MYVAGDEYVFLKIFYDFMFPQTLHALYLLCSYDIVTNVFPRFGALYTEMVYYGNC